MSCVHYYCYYYYLHYVDATARLPSSNFFYGMLVSQRSGTPRGLDTFGDHYYLRIKLFLWVDYLARGPLFSLDIILNIIATLQSWTIDHGNPYV